MSIGDLAQVAETAALLDRPKALGGAPVDRFPVQCSRAMFWPERGLETVAGGSQSWYGRNG